MSKYDVAVSVTIEMFYTVEADSEESAKEIAEGLAYNEDYGLCKTADSAEAWSIAPAVE